MAYIEVPSAKEARRFWQQRQACAPRWADLVDDADSAAGGAPETTPTPQQSEVEQLRAEVATLAARITYLEEAAARAPLEQTMAQLAPPHHELNVYVDSPADLAPSGGGPDADSDGEACDHVHCCDASAGVDPATQHPHRQAAEGDGEAYDHVHGGVASAGFDPATQHPLRQDAEGDGEAYDHVHGGDAPAGDDSAALHPHHEDAEDDEDAVDEHPPCGDSMHMHETEEADDVESDIQMSDDASAGLQAPSVDEAVVASDTSADTVPAATASSAAPSTDITRDEIGSFRAARSRRTRSGTAAAAFSAEEIDLSWHNPISDEQIMGLQRLRDRNAALLRAHPFCEAAEHLRWSVDECDMRIALERQCRRTQQRTGQPRLPRPRRGAEAP